MTRRNNPLWRVAQGTTIIKVRADSHADAISTAAPHLTRSQVRYAGPTSLPYGAYDVI